MSGIDGRAHAYLSPHLDDAVLSCGGRMWQQVQAGDEVTVVTIFAGTPDPKVPFSPFAEELHARWGEPVDVVRERQREDREALAALGVEALHWRYADCIYRRTPEGDPAYGSEASLWGRIHPAEGKLIQELAKRIRALRQASGAVLYVPLAVGRHVDHRVARQAAERCEIEEHPPGLIYYEDYPYAEEPGCVIAALSGAWWREELVLLSPEGVRAKTAAIARYRSQMSTFWGDRAGMEASVRAFAERTGGGAPAERYWHRVLGS
jgi:LmbE family N-acetylglucosaminyl deacetylase